MTEYITITPAKITNNKNAYVETWQSGRTFNTGDWIQDGRLYLGPNLPNRWIPTGTYKLTEVTPPPPPPSADRIINIRKIENGICVESKYYQEIPAE